MTHPPTEPVTPVAAVPYEPTWIEAARQGKEPLDDNDRRWLATLSVLERERREAVLLLEEAREYLRVGWTDEEALARRIDALLARSPR